MHPIPKFQNTQSKNSCNKENRKIHNYKKKLQTSTASNE